MKEKFKLNPDTLLVLVILAMVIVAGVVSAVVELLPSNVASLDSYRTAFLPLNVLAIIKLLLIILTGFFVFLIVKRVVRREKWDTKYYGSVKRIGWLSVLILLLDSISSVVHDDFITQNKDISNIATDATIYGKVISHALFSNPLAWFLIAVIFLVADILLHANNREVS